MKTDPSSQQIWTNVDEVALIRSSALFDAVWYLNCYPDVAAADLDPAYHYARYGGFEGRNPGPAFCSALYLDMYADVRQAGMNPLLHYLRHGASEGRVGINQYDGWLAGCDSLDAFDRRAIQTRIAGLTGASLLSIVMPVFETALDHLAAALASVQQQSYQHWQLCVVDDGSTEPDLRALLQQASANDDRIEVTWRRWNGGICAATNTGLRQAKGEFVGLLDHDDLLHENALYEVVELLDTHPETDLIYTDSDLITDGGLRYGPYFKPDWNHELMLGHNLVSHFGVYRRSVVNAVGGMRAAFEGSQDWDLALRVAAAAGPSRIRHIPTVLYHWRQSDRRASYSEQYAQRCQDAGGRAVTEHVRALGLLGTVEPSSLAPCFNRFTPALLEPPPMVTVAILVETAEGLSTAVADLWLLTEYPSFELLLVASEKVMEPLETVLGQLVQAYRIELLRSADHSYEALRAAAINAARGAVVVVITGAMSIRHPGWLRELASQAMRSDVGLVGPTVVDAEGGILHAGQVSNAPRAPCLFRLGHSGYFGMFALVREVSSLAPACIAFRRDAAPAFRPGWGLDQVSDLLRQQGRRTLVTPFAALVRHVPAPVSAELTPRTGEDPFYNPNLALDTLFHRLAHPSRRVRPWSAERRRLMIREGQSQRATTLLVGIDRSARLLEVGASYSPIAPRAEGWNAAIVDHAPRQVLVEKYVGHPDIWVERIEDVDFIWTEGTLADAVPASEHGSFDVLVASHVIEHTPDLVAFFSAAQRILRPEGVIVLAVPDKRFCFDYFRPIALTADVLEAHDARRTRHTRRTGYAHWAHTVLNNGEGAWGQHKLETLRFANSFSVAMAMRNGLSEAASAAYVDLHNWTFTPSSFQLILLELARLGLCDWQVDWINPAEGCEFRTRLRRGAIDSVEAMSEQAFDAKRLTLLQSMVEEFAEQIAYAPAAS
jgi:SAM-dependent methyltransferase